MAGASSHNKIFFGGGWTNGLPSKTVDIYDVITNSWSKMELSEAKAELCAVGIGDKVIFAGGTNGGSSMSNYFKSVDIFTVFK